MMNRLPSTPTVTIGLSLLIAALLGPSADAQTNDLEQFQKDFLSGNLTWKEVEARAKEEGKVNFFYQGGNSVLNVWVDSVAGTAMRDLGIELSSERLSATRGAISEVISEAEAGQGLGQGKADLIWLNGDNFYQLDQQDLLFGSFAKLLPNAKNYDWRANERRAHENLWDFGVEIKGREIAWSSEQFVCAVDRAHVARKDTPETFPDLLAYLKNNPGTFSYVRPPNGIGNTFVQSVLIALAPSGNDGPPFQSPLASLDEKQLSALLRPGMEYLRSLAPLVNQIDGGANYPVDVTEADHLFREGNIHFTCEFGTYAAATKVAIGHYPDTAEAMIFPRNAMIKNKNYLAIPANAANPAAALVLANFMSSVEAQASKLGFVGYPTGIDHWMLDKKDLVAIEKAAPPYIGVTQSQLDANAVPDVHASFVDLINAVWLAYVDADPAPDFDQMLTEILSELDETKN